MLPERITLLPIVLRPFVLSDAPRVRLLAGDPKVAQTTSVIPYPYGEGMAEQWIARHAALRDRGAAFIYAIVRAEDGVLVGAVEAEFAPDAIDTLGYWIGQPYWGLGYATAAARAVIALCFRYLDCHQLTASHLVRNPASGRVLEKCGLVPVQRLERMHRGKLEEFCVRGITRDAWEKHIEEDSVPTAKRT